ncbi:PorV/PorQ family protein [Pigmentibacter ruber]|uniref:hypothetical protein n=1 Tax=Pigmentibacter ruber TaxID=2683196 RepID=UPI00131E3916|nr:hypothetical protein [Pigmentibacter ruber]
MKIKGTMQNKSCKKFFFTNIILFCLHILFCFPSYADWWHNNSFIMGGRPAGMGGAYTGIATGAAGIYYNPGGMGFSPDLQLSVSTTNYYTSTIKQQGYLSDSSTGFELGDADLLNGYFGGIFRLDTETPIFLAFAIYNKDYVNIDNVVASYSSDGKNKTRYVQKTSSTENEYAFGGAVRINPQWSIGASIAFFDIKYSEVQNANIVGGPFDDPDNPGNQLYTYEMWNYTSSFFVRGIEGGLGVAYKPNDYISFGLSGKYKFIMAQGADSTYVDNQVITNSNFVPLGSSSTYPFNQYLNKSTIKEDDRPFGKLPSMLRFGIGLYPLEFQTITADIAYYSANQANNPFYQTKEVFDYFLGSETIIYEKVALRLGYFTNNWSGDPSVKDQIINVNFIGYTVGISYLNKNSSYGFIWMHQQSKPGAQYQLEESLASSSNNPSVTWTTNQFAIIITGEM